MSLECEEILRGLAKVSGTAHFLAELEELTQEWGTQYVDSACVDCVLLFMEKNPGLDYGMPGPLVHWVEGFYRKGYEEKLVASLKRKPVAHTLWMLNRIINDSEGETRARYISILKEVLIHPDVEEDVKQVGRLFLSEL